MSRFQSEEFIKRYFKPELLTAVELKKIVDILLKNKKVQKLAQQDAAAIDAVLKRLCWR